MIKKLSQLFIVLCVIYSAPLLMDHARDIYLNEVVAKKAHPVKVGARTIGSSFQVKHNGVRLTVTNNHVCSVAKQVQKTADQQRALFNYIQNTLNGVKNAKEIYTAELEKLKKKVYSIVGATLKIGNTNRTILYNSKVHDICFLEPVGDTFFSLASSVHRGERITIIGHPRGFPQSISDGRIVGEQIKAFPWIFSAGFVKVYLSTAISYPGNSGSPVVNRYGNVVGILFAGTSINYININYVVPVSYIYSELDAYTQKQK